MKQNLKLMEQSCFCISWLPVTGILMYSCCVLELKHLRPGIYIGGQDPSTLHRPTLIGGWDCPPVKSPACSNGIRWLKPVRGSKGNAVTIDLLFGDVSVPSEACSISTKQFSLDLLAEMARESLILACSSEANGLGSLKMKDWCKLSLVTIQLLFVLNPCIQL